MRHARTISYARVDTKPAPTVAIAILRYRRLLRAVAANRTLTPRRTKPASGVVSRQAERGRDMRRIVQQGPRGHAHLLDHQDRRDDAGRNRRRYGHHDPATGAISPGPRCSSPCWCVLVAGQIVAKQIPPVPLLGDHHRLDDLRHHHGGFRRPLARHRLHRRLVAAARLPAGGAGLWYWSRGSISVDTVTTPRVEVFYWAAITFSQTLGTALGDWMADSTGLGYEGGALVFGAGSGGRRRRLLLDQRVAGDAVLDRLHPDPAAGRDRRRFPRQACQPWRPCVEPPAGFGGDRGIHPGLPADSAATRRLASGSSRSGARIARLF